MTCLYDLAVKYRQLGFFVIPIARAELGNKASGKASVLKGWPDREPLTDAELRRYFQHQQCNIALRLDDVVVADCDTQEAIDYVEQHFGTTGWIQQSGSGKRHYFYKAP